MAKANLMINAVVTGPDGFYHRTEHEWHGVNDEMMSWFQTNLGNHAEFCKKLAADGKKGNLRAALNVSVDNVAQPTVVITGISKADLVKAEEAWQHLGDALVEKAKRMVSK